MVYFIEFFILLLLPAKKLYFDASLLCFLTLPANHNIYTRFLNTNVNLKLKIYVNTIINIKKDIRDENRLFTSAICFRSFSLFCVKPLLCCHCCFTWILSLTLMIFNGMLSLSVFSSLILLQELPFAMCQSFKLRQIAVCTLIIHTYLPSVLYYKHFNMITCPFSHLNGSVCRRPSRWCFRRTYF